MADDKFLKKLVSNVSSDMDSFREELESYKYVVDMTRVDQETAKKIEGKLNTKFPKLRDYESWDDTITVHNKTGRFFVLQSKAQINLVENMITKSEDTDERFSQGLAAQERKEEFIINKSSKAKARLSAAITNKTQEYLTLASPSFVAEFQDKIVGKLNSLELTFNVPENKKLQNTLAQSVLHSVDKELRSLKRNTILDQAMENRIKSLGETFETGKSLKRNTKSKKKITSNKKTKSKKSYYVALQDSKGLFISAPSLQATLNLLLHDTIQDKFMHASGEPSNRNYLRYQTGRFAKSATVLNVNKQRGATLDVTFDYMTDPYITFTRGNHGIGRNPERIIEGAIRDILIRHVSDRFNANVRMR